MVDRRQSGAVAVACPMAAAALAAQAPDKTSKALNAPYLKLAEPWPDAETRRQWQRVEYSVPYDFDYAGLVDTPYARPNPKLRIVSVRDRVYRGPCGSEAEFDRVLEKFRAKKAEVMALYDSVPDLDASYRKDARSYLEMFYTATERSRLRKTLVDGCVRAPAM